MSLPYVLSNTYESLIAVPNTYREASYALGASKVSTTFKVIIPSAGARILTGVVIAIGRIIGETAPILFTGAAFYITRNPTSIFEPAMSLPTHIYVLATIYPSNVQPKLEGTVSVLLLIVIILFGFIGILRARDIRKRER
jgi:phosphate transport system permease protein